MRGKQQLGCLRVRDGVIMLEKMFFADEIRPTKRSSPGRPRSAKQELALALELIERFTGTSTREVRGHYREALLEVIKRKQKGKEVHVEPQPKPEEPTDLLDALRASLESHSRSRGSRGGGTGLEELSKEKLAKRAAKAGIEGRSRMTKDELVRALQQV